LEVTLQLSPHHNFSCGLGQSNYATL
jgi:hypothetical protein